MEREERRTARRPARPAGKSQPIPLDAVDLLAGIAPGMELEADPLPAGIAGAEETEPALTSVDDVGRLLRMAEPTVRRLVRTKGIDASTARGAIEPQPGPFVPCDPDKPSE